MYTTTAILYVNRHISYCRRFLPLLLPQQSAVGEFTRSIFQVVTIALVLSWFAAVVVIPYLGYKILPDHVAHDPNVSETRFY